MAITVEAVYEDGVLKPSQPLPLMEHARVQITIQPPAGLTAESRGILGCTDPQLIEWAALDADLEFPAPAEGP
jgi:predicted DNA-binding antitoxin AbrB/MazE fold protein